MAVLVVQRLTPYKIVQRSRKRTGFDYWLAEKESEFPFQHAARLEVSGILAGSAAQIKRRVKEKWRQTQKSNNLKLPVYVVVIEFSKPVSNVAFEK